MDIHPTCSCLLERSCIHDVDAVTSILHKKFKFMVGDKLMIVYGEEDFVISELSSFRYVETKEGIAEVPFHYLDFEDVISTSVNQSQPAVVVLSSTRSAKKTLEKSPLSGWGQIVKVAEKHDHFGLGYHPASCHTSARGLKNFNLIWLSNPDYQYDLSIAVVDGASSSKIAVSNFIRKCPPRFKLDNWTFTIIHVVFFRKYLMHFVFSSLSLARGMWIACKGFHCF